MLSRRAGEIEGRKQLSAEHNVTLEHLEQSSVYHDTHNALVKRLTSKLLEMLVNSLEETHIIPKPLGFLK